MGIELTLLEDRRWADSYHRKITESLSRHYAHTVESFLRTLGVTEDNIEEYQMCTTDEDEDKTTVTHNGTPIGLITRTLESSERGTSWHVKCQRLAKK